MARVSDLDFGWTCVIRVLEQGIELIDRSMPFLMNGSFAIFQWKSPYSRNGSKPDLWKNTFSILQKREHRREASVHQY
jgi:hypothetical protein